jgi:hypothetical protein
MPYHFTNVYSAFHEGSARRNDCIAICDYYDIEKYMVGQAERVLMYFI